MEDQRQFQLTQPRDSLRTSPVLKRPSTGDHARDSSDADGNQSNTEEKRNPSSQATMTQETQPSVDSNRSSRRYRRCCAHNQSNYSFNYCCCCCCYSTNYNTVQPSSFQNVSSDSCCGCDNCCKCENCCPCDSGCPSICECCNSCDFGSCNTCDCGNCNGCDCGSCIGSASDVLNGCAGCCTLLTALCPK